MKFKLSFVLFFILFSSEVFSQEFEKVVSQISSELNEVTTKTEIITQKIVEVSKGVVEITQTTTQIKGGKSQVEVFMFNPADIDINTVRTMTSKDVIQVQLLAVNKQQLIKKVVDHVKISYVNSLFIQSLDVNNGRIVVDLFKSLIPICTDLTDKRLSLKTYQDHLDWLTKEIVEVGIGDKMFDQKLTTDTKFAGRLSYSLVEATSKTTKKTVYELNAMNINPNSILFKVKGDVFSIEIGTKRKLQLIKEFVNDEQKDFTNNFQIICKNVEQARDLQKVLKNFVSLSEVEFNKNLPKINTVTQAFNIINDIIAKVTVNDVTFTQNFDSNCVVNFKKNEASASKNLLHEYSFNFSDINKNIISYETKRQFLSVNVPTLAKNDFMQYFTDKVQKNYTNSLDIIVSEIEQAIIVENALKYIVEQCEKNNVNYSGKSKSELIEMLSKNISNVTMGSKTMNQTVSKGKTDVSISFKSIEISEKSSKERLYEFNYTDINQANIKFETSQKNVYVSFGTKFNEKIIQYYEDGVIKNYQNSVRIEASSIENARVICSILKELVGK